MVDKFRFYALLSGFWIRGCQFEFRQDHCVLFMGLLVYPHNVSSPNKLYQCVLVKPRGTRQNAEHDIIIGRQFGEVCLTESDLCDLVRLSAQFQTANTTLPCRLLVLFSGGKVKRHALLQRSCRSL